MPAWNPDSLSLLISFTYSNFLLIYLVISISESVIQLSAENLMNTAKYCIIETSKNQKAFSFWGGFAPRPPL